MLRTDLIRAVQAYLRSNYTGPVTIHAEEDDAEIEPPYAIVRATIAEDMGADQADIWDINLVVAVMHDADATTIETAEAQAATVFATLHDPAPVITALAGSGIAASCFHRLTSEAGSDGMQWQHFHAFRVIASPAAND